MDRIADDVAKRWCIHSGKLTEELNIDKLNVVFPLKETDFYCYISLPEGTFLKICASKSLWHSILMVGQLVMIWMAAAVIMFEGPMTDPWDWYLFTYIYHKKSTIHVGKYIIPMDASWGISPFVWPNNGDKWVGLGWNPRSKACRIPGGHLHPGKGPHPTYITK